MDHRKIEEMVSKKLLKQRKVFGKIESERMLTRKVWDHIIDLKKTFKPQKENMYPLFKDEREEVQKFVKNQLKKRYIRPSNHQCFSQERKITEKEQLWTTIV